MCGDPGISAFPEGDNIFCWKGTITGTKDTVYEGMVYRLSLSFPNDYPFKPPKVKFESVCFHPNVDLNGGICLDILQVYIESYCVSSLLSSMFLCLEHDLLIFYVCQEITNLDYDDVHGPFRINGHLHMMWEPYCSQFRVFWEVILIS